RAQPDPVGHALELAAVRNGPFGAVVLAHELQRIIGLNPLAPVEEAKTAEVVRRRRPSHVGALVAAREFRVDPDPCAVQLRSRVLDVDVEEEAMLEQTEAPLVVLLMHLDPQRTVSLL